MPQLASPSRPSRLHVLIAVLAVALPSAAVGAKSDELLAFARAQLTDESPAASDPSGSKRGSRTPSQQARAQPLPRQAQAIREALDLELPPGAEVELVARLGVLGDATDEARLLSLSEHEEYRIRSAAIEALGRLGTPRAVDRLAILAASMDSRLNYQATRALGLSAAPEAAVVLQELAEHPVPRRREVAITALSVRGGGR